MRTVYWVWSMILFASIIVQIGLAGYGAFYAANKLDDEGSTIDDQVFEDGFGLHAAWGYLVILFGLIFMIIGLIAGHREVAPREARPAVPSLLHPALARLDRLRAPVPGRLPPPDQRVPHRRVVRLDRLGRDTAAQRCARSGSGDVAAGYSGVLWCVSPTMKGVVTPA